MAVPVIAARLSSDSGAAPVETLQVDLPSGSVAGSFITIIVGQDETSAVTFSATNFTVRAYAGERESDAQLGVLTGNISAAQALQGYVTVDSTGDDEMWAEALRITGADETNPTHGTPETSQIASENVHTAYGNATITTVDDCLVFAALCFDGGDGNPFAISGTDWSSETIYNIQSGDTGTDCGGCYATHNKATAGQVPNCIFTATGTVSDGAALIMWALAPAAGSGREVTCAPEGIAVTESDATITTNVPRAVDCSPENTIITEPNATITTNVPRVVTCIPEDIVITENDATIITDASRVVSCSPESTAITENEALVNASRHVRTGLIAEFTDSFTDTDATPLQDHTPDKGDSWTLINGSMEIVNNKATGAGIFFNAAGVDAGLSDGVIDVYLKPVGVISSGGPGLFFRKNSFGDVLVSTWQLTIRQYTGSTDEINLIRWGSGGGSEWSETNTSLGANINIERHVKVVLSGASVKVYVDGFKLFDTTDPTLASNTKYGIFCSDDNRAEIENFNVYSGSETRVTITELSANINRGLVVDCASESIAVTENDAVIDLTQDLWSADAIHFTVDDDAFHTADGWHSDDRAVGCTPEIVAVIENDATVVKNASLWVICSSESIAFTGNLAAINRTLEVVSDTESILVVENDAQIQVGIHREVICDPEIVQITENQANINRALTLTCNVESVLVSENDAQIQRGINREVTCSTEITLVTENSATIALDRQVQGLIESILIFENQATVIRGSVSARRVMIVS